MQDDEAYQRQLDIAAQADAEEGIRQGLEDERKEMLRPAREFFEEFEAAHPELYIKEDAGGMPNR
ncbi:MAG: hypothetical protein ABSC47_02580 [Terracidiphilus sp.]|jgi:hypothetical protein